MRRNTSLIDKFLHLIGRKPVENDDYDLDDESSFNHADRSPSRKLGRLGRRDPIDDDYEDAYKPGGSILGIISAIVLFPIRVLLLPFQGLSLFHDTGVDLEFDKDELTFSQKLKHRLAWLAKTILLLPFRLVMVPIHFFQSLTIASRADILFILPAVLMVVLFGFVFAQVFVRAGMIEQRYKRGAQLAFSDKNFELAKTYYERLKADDELAPNQLFTWAQILARTGEIERADEVFEKLAPDDQPGYSPAHALKAIAIARSLGNSKDPEILRKLDWHLRNTYEEFPELSEARARFYLASEEYGEAVKELEKTAENFPQHYLTIANIHRSRGQNAERQLALEKAEKIFRKQLEKEKFNHRIRIQLADVVAQMQRFDEAEELLAKGLRLQPDDRIKKALSQFFVLRHDTARQAQLDSGVQLRYLVAAMNHDPNNGTVYQRLMVMYMESDKTDENMIKVRETFQKIVTGDHPSSMAHFALSNVLWQEGKLDEAQFHLEQAYNMDNKILVVVNNLAWMISHVENPDLDRALELAETAISQAPNDARFRDTYGTILLKMERYKEASTELELALRGVTDKKAVHQKLALVYQKMGKPELATLHQQQGRPENGTQ